MDKILSYVRRCVEDYDMIAPGDRIAVGVSGGKDSLTLLYALAKLREFYPVPFTVEAYTLDMGHADGREGIDYSGVAAFCERIGVPFTLLPSEIHHIIFDLRREKNPCSMCAKMRRGALHNAMLEHGITKIALGHHFDDAVETFFLSLFYEGRLSCFQPVTYLDRTGITQIRPLLYCTEGMIRGAAARSALPVVFNPCPADGNTKRQEIKELIAELNRTYPGLKSRVFGAMQGLPLPEWGPVRQRRLPPTDDGGPEHLEKEEKTMFYDLAKSRYSVRKFSDKPLEEEKLQKILEAGRIAPTARNLQPQKVFVIRSAEALAKVNTLSPCIYGASTVLLVCCDEDKVWHHPQVDGYTSDLVDCSIVTTHMMLQAQELGVGSCWVAMFVPEDASRVFELPANLRPVALMPLGYPAEDCPVSPSHEELRGAEETIAYL